MKELKFRKISDEGNVYGFNEIIILESRIDSVKIIERDNEPLHLYKYEYLALADGELTYLEEIEWCEMSKNYELVKGDE